MSVTIARRIELPVSNERESPFLQAQTSHWPYQRIRKTRLEALRVMVVDDIEVLVVSFSMRREHMSFESVLYMFDSSDYVWSQRRCR